MKLLGWMHNKFRQTNNEMLKDFAIENNSPTLSGQLPLHEQYYRNKPRYGTKPCGQTERGHRRKSFAGLETTQVEEEEDYEEEALETMSEIFHGFLAIGTLGFEHIISAPSTPTFTISLEEKAGKETEVTERELKLLNDNLEKTLGAESCDASSRRNSHVSNGRSSNGSTITLSGKALEIPEANKTESSVCPLEGYLFRSVIEQSETTAVAKKEHRTSLRELFQKTKMTEENPGGKSEREEKRTAKETDKSAVNILKKMLKKKVPRLTRSSSAASGRTANSTSAEKKMNRILQMFHRKVHPEESTTSEKHVKLLKNEKKNRVVSRDSGHNYEGQTIPNGLITPGNVKPDNGIERYKSHCDRQLSLSTDSNGNRELWIKTDADYFVLEL